MQLKLMSDVIIGLIIIISNIPLIIIILSTWIISAHFVRKDMR